MNSSYEKPWHLFIIFYTSTSGLFKLSVSLILTLFFPASPPSLGITGKEFSNVAGPRENTCSDCPEGADGEGSCRDNLLQEVVGGGTLTSGYSGEAIVNGQRVGKPRGVGELH